MKLSERKQCLSMEKRHSQSLFYDLIEYEAYNNMFEC